MVEGGGETSRQPQVLFLSHHCLFLETGSFNFLAGTHQEGRASRPENPRAPPTCLGSAGIANMSTHSQYFLQESSDGLQALVLEGEHFDDSTISPGPQVCSYLSPSLLHGSKGGSCSAI